MIITLLELYHRPEIGASLPTFGFFNSKDKGKSLVHWAIDSGMQQGTTWQVSLLVTLRVYTMAIFDSKRRNELRTSCIGAVDAILGRPYKGSFIETTKLLVIQTLIATAAGTTLPQQRGGYSSSS